MEEKVHRLQELYDSFESEAAAYKAGAACRRGCAYCCSDAGSIDITTLEGLVIRAELRRLPRPRQLTVRKALSQDMRRREAGQTNACPFLMKNKTCLIYGVRPFGCRRIYSVQACNPNAPPRLSRTVMEIAQETIRQLQRLDDTGYSGHISFILHMLEAPKFLATYLGGEHKPEEVMLFGRAHRIRINRMGA
jgi:Fe-S-cluster containining protein